MIPENIKKLLKSDNVEDKKIGFELARAANLHREKEFLRFVGFHVYWWDGCSNYVSKQWDSARKTYNYFEFID